jgi:hypothetical protein
MKTKAVKKFEIGTLKLMVERVMSYVGMINFFMILYLYIQQSPIGIDAVYWIVAVSFFLPIMTILDWVFVYPSTLNVSYGRKNKEFQELRADIKRLETKLDEQIKNK